VLVTDATRADFGRVFDSVVLLDVLEHIEDDVGMLRRIRGMLRPGGMLILKVPAMPFLMCRMDRAIGHYRRYGKRSLAARLEEAGFAAVEQRHFNAAAVAAWFINGTLLRRVTPPGGQLAAFERLVPVLRFLETLLRPGFGISLVTVAKVKDDVLFCGKEPKGLADSDAAEAEFHKIPEGF
jgi:SAM-dependent methyltransferase